MDEAMRDCPDEVPSQGASYKFPLSPLHIDEAGLQVPFIPLPGESVKVLGTSTAGLLALSNYRLFLETLNGNYNIPLGLIEICEVRDIFYLHVQCKEARTVRCTFSTNDQCMEWFKRIHRATQTPSNLQDLFAFSFYAWTMELGDAEMIFRLLGEMRLNGEQLFRKEVERLRFDTHGAWRITQANVNYRLSPSYPPFLLVPACITDDTLEVVARYRSSRRIPVIVWRHVGNGAVIARCSQPEVGWLGWRSNEDEDLLKAMADACSFDRGAQSMLDVTPTLDSSPQSLNAHMEENPLSNPGVTLSEGKKVLIMDARSYTTAVANRARGGGCECPEYYPSCDIEFMNLANIHAIRKSFQGICQLCASPADLPNWFSLLEGTKWLQHMSGLIRAATILASAIEREGRPVLVHCSDGWDRTPQIVALGQILLDPYYRTFEGFRVLCEREWLDFGHKFADRCGHVVGPDDPNERCPVFLQWLDCIHQLLHQFPCSFEFSQTYLVKLAKHTYSNLFGTFLCNSRQERESKHIFNSTFSVWPFLTDINFRNHLYATPNENDHVLWPAYNVRDLHLWSEIYLGSLEADMTIEPGTTNHAKNTTFVNVRENSVNGEISISMTKTRSYGDLQMAADTLFNRPRRSSDPNILTESIKLETLTLCERESFDPKTLDHLNNIENKLPLVSKAEQVPNDVSECKQLAYVNVRKDMDSECTNTETKSEQLDSKEEESVIQSNGLCNGKSVETSTETIIADNGGVCGPNSAVEANDSIRNTSNVGGTCKVCSQRRRFIADKYRRKHKPCVSDKNSRCSLSPSHTCTPLLPTGSVQKPLHKQCDLDGLAPLCSSIQTRLRQIVTDHKTKEDALERELHTTRMALLQQVCHHCTNEGSDTHDETCSVGGSVCSLGEGHMSANESLPSDVSWEALDEPSHIPDSIIAAPTLWVPDHAVSRCTGCHTEFWLGRRKHHCRNCGRIFCADCSENSAPLPNEQLYNPVRVCMSCFSQLNLGANNNFALLNTTSNCDANLDQTKENGSCVGAL